MSSELELTRGALEREIGRGIAVDAELVRVRRERNEAARAAEALKTMTEALEAERDALRAAIETSDAARLAADVVQLVNDYSDPNQSVIARLPFLATFDQVCFEKYGITTTEDADR